MSQLPETRGHWRAILSTSAALFALALGGWPTGAHAVNWDEAADGDLSNNRLAPSAFNVAAGVNSLIATMPDADLDYVTLHVPEGHTLSGLTLVSYQSSDGTSFIGMQAGAAVTSTGSAVTLLGYTHFGTGRGNVGDDILPDMCNGAGAMGCAPPLASGAYSLWIQQQSGANVTYQFDFTVTAPEPEGLPGDYTDDGLVDAADFVAWRDYLGAPEGTLPNDPDGGEVGAAQYETWRSKYGAVDQGPAGATAAPEASAVALVLMATGGLGLCRARGAKTPG